jgi:hypothetical protein
MTGPVINKAYKMMVHVGDMRNSYRMSENLKGRDYLEDLNGDGKAILKWI